MIHGLYVRSRCLAKFILICVLISRTALAQEPPLIQLGAIEPTSGTTTPGTKTFVYGTGLPPDSVVYFDGLQAREIRFISPSTLQVVTPYLRPGTYKLQLKYGEQTIRTDVTFTASPSSVDSEIDRAIGASNQGQTAIAIAILQSVAKNSPDFQVRAFAHYQAAQIYFAIGDWWRGAGQASMIFDPGGGPAVQTSWRYRLASDESTYLLPIENDPDSALRLADWTVKFDVTQNPEPRFFRALVNARYGNLQKAKTDCEFILALRPDNVSYQALAAYIAALSASKAKTLTLAGQPIRDPRALSLFGQAAFIAGNTEVAQTWWLSEAKVYPSGASIAYWAGKKHLARGQKKIAAALLTECITVAPNTDQAKEARDLLSNPPQ